VGLTSVAAAFVAGHRDNIYRQDVVTATSGHELAGTRAGMNGTIFTSVRATPAEI
jgi:hypothetical protein